MRVGKGRVYIYQKGYQHGQAIQLLSVIMLHDLCVTVCVCSEGSALFHIIYGSHLGCHLVLEYMHLKENITFVCAHTANAA